MKPMVSLSLLPEVRCRSHGADGGGYRECASERPVNVLLKTARLISDCIALHAAFAGIHGKKDARIPTRVSVFRNQRSAPWTPIRDAVAGVGGFLLKDRPRVRVPSFHALSAGRVDAKPDLGTA